jgi:hypothetical protein
VVTRPQALRQHVHGLLVDRVLHDRILHIVRVPEIVRYEPRGRPDRLAHVRPLNEPVVTEAPSRSQRRVEQLHVPLVTL